MNPKVNKILERFSKNPLLHFGTLSVFLFLILFIASPSTLSKGNFYFSSEISDAPSAAQSTQNLFLNQSLAAPLEFPDLSLIQDSSLKGVSPPNVFRSETLGTLGDGYEEKKEVVEYVVQDGDSLWSIAQKFGVSKETIIWANDVKNSLIKPDQKLLILPVDGVMHLVKEGDRLEDLAKKYKADEKKIIEFNQLSEDEYLFLGELLIIPGGKMPNAPKEGQRVKFADMSGRKHYYPWGWCTWWVEHKRAIPTSWGNAINWLDRAAAQGFDVCKGSRCSPKAGAIISVATQNPKGHVAYVEEVKDDVVIFSEMNYLRLGNINSRRMKIGDSRIKGYIY